jgi:MFS family permease
MSAFTDSLTLLRTRRFSTFWVASFLSNIGTWTQQIAEPWLLVSIGASPFLVGLDSFMMAAPAWLLTPIGGVLADLGDRRRVITVYQSIQMLCPITLVGLVLADVVEPWMVIVLSSIVGVTDAISMPSFQTIVPTIVRRNQIAAGLALSSTQFNLSRILGPVLAGILLASLGAVACFAANALSYLPFILVALWILPRGRNTEGRTDFDKHHPLAGYRKIVKRPELRGAIATALVTSTLSGPLITFAPVLVKQAFGGNATAFSSAIGGFGGGALIGAIALLAVDSRRDRRVISSRAGLVCGATVAAAALAPSLWMLPAVMAATGLAMNVSNTSANTFLQSAAPPRLRGQTVSLFMMAMRGGTAIGSLAAGLTIEFFGVREALLINAALAVIAQFALGRAWCRMRLEPLKMN